MRDNAGVTAFVGRSKPLARLTAAYEDLTSGPVGAIRGAGLVLVTGEAGIGKTALLNRFAADVAARGAHGGAGHVLGRRPGPGVVAMDPGTAAHCCTTAPGCTPRPAPS